MKKRVLIITFLLLNLILTTNVYAITNGQATKTVCSYPMQPCPAGLQSIGNVVFDYKCENGFCTIEDVETIGTTNQIINSQTNYIPYFIIGLSIIIGFIILGLILRKRKNNQRS